MLGSIFFANFISGYGRRPFGKWHTGFNEKSVCIHRERWWPLALLSCYILCFRWWLMRPIRARNNLLQVGQAWRVAVEVALLAVCSFSSTSVLCFSLACMPPELMSPQQVERSQAACSHVSMLMLKDFKQFFKSSLLIWSVVWMRPIWKWHTAFIDK